MTWRRRDVRRGAWLLGVVLVAGVAAAQEAAAPTGADWELPALGVSVGERLEAACAIAGRRPVVLAIVGQGGVGEALLEPALGEHATLEYREGASDPGANTHDTQAARVILDLTSRLGVRLTLLVYHPGPPFRDVAEAMAKAGAEADIVAFFQSFWGPDASLITESIRAADGCLFVSPYVEYMSYPTSTCVQAHSAKPWSHGLAHFITAAPIAFRAPGQVLQPASGEEDADTSQREAIAAATMGQSFILVGPPGTGKSQTIANIIAECIAKGRKVLFVSEKAAALEVVYRRLEERGLHPFCLDLHSARGHKREVLEQLRHALELGGTGEQAPGDFGAVEDQRRMLNAYAKALHEPFGALGWTPFAVHGALARSRDVPASHLSACPQQAVHADGREGDSA